MTQQIHAVDPKGRLDILILRLGEALCQRVQVRTGLDFWNDGGLREAANQFIDELQIPRAQINIPQTLLNALRSQPQLQTRRRIVRRRRRRAA
jgi:hypothetical protein